MNIYNICSSFERQPISGSLILFSIFAIFPVLCIPAYVIAIAAGFIYYTKFGIWGLVIASPIFWIGSSTGSILALLNARYLCADCTSKLTQKHLKFRIIQRLSQNNSFKVTLAFRLAPIPFVAMNYLLGSTKLKLKGYVFANITLIPRSIIYPLIGSTIGSLSDASSEGQNATKRPENLGLLLEALW